MAPSQLAQLKSALSSSGLSRTSQSKKSKSKGKAGLTSKDREKKQKRLDEIKEGLNKFDVREGKVKFDVGGKGNIKGAKGVSGRPSESRSKGLEQRKASLLPEHNLRRTGHTGTFIDRRFGESNPTLTPEERALERFTLTKEAERRAGATQSSKRGRFNLEDDIGLFGGDDDDNAGHLGSMLTHGGKTIDELKGDDFNAQGLDDDDEDEDDFGLSRRGPSEEGRVEKRRDREGVEDEDEPERKKTKAEVMAEVILKSKTHKYERQQQKELDEDLRMQLDDDLTELRALLQPTTKDPMTGFKTSTTPFLDPNKTGSNDVPLGSRPNAITPVTATTDIEAGPSGSKPTPNMYAQPSAEATKTANDMDYDQYVRSLAFDRRAKPKDRIKTEEELAKEEVEKLQAAEKARLRRMKGLDPEDDEDVGGKGKRRKGKGKEIEKKRKVGERRPEGDDLSDDFILSGDDEEGMGSDDDEGYGLGAGIAGEEMVNYGTDSSISEDEDEEDDEGSDEDEDEDMEDEQLSGDIDMDDDGDDLPQEELITATTSKSSKKSKALEKEAAAKEVPYTFKCPQSHEDLLEIMDGLAEKDVEVVVKRIRALYHPSLGEGNKQLLEAFLGILIDHVLYLSSTGSSFSTISLLTPHIVSLVALNPITAASHFTTKLSLMQKNLARGLTRGALLPDSKTFPGAPELVLLRLTGLIWSTSDFSNPVAAPAQLLMGQYLSQSRVRGLGDVASGLFLCSILLQYESFSKRLIPEAINFLAQVLVLLAPKTASMDNYPGCFPITDITSATEDGRASKLRLKPKAASALVVQSADLPGLLASDDLEGIDLEQAKVDLLATTFKLVSAYSAAYVDSETFIEIFEPLQVLMVALVAVKLPESLMSTANKSLDSLNNLLKSSRQARRPLTMQAEALRPVALPTFTPKFDASFSLGKRADPDAERNAAAKLKALYKKEKKGAIRELRKDNKFLAGEKAKEQKSKDEEYTKKMRRVEGEIATTERAEEKAMEREKLRDKKRSGGKGR